VLLLCFVVRPGLEVHNAVASCCFIDVIVLIMADSRSIAAAVLRLQGFAYIEFLEADAVDNAIMLDNSELRGRQIKVC
jgi:hypothetical protein